MEAELVSDIWTIAQVILIDLALGGDNSIVIGMAAKNFPPRLQKKAIIYGTIGAIGLRFLLAALVVWLLQIPYLKTIGALLLVLIGIRLIGANDDGEDIHVKAKDSLFEAICTIMAADALMSLDNVLGIVGATGGHLGLLVAGMMISVPIIVFGSTIVIKIMNRFPILMYVGGAILGWAAGGMLASDPYFPWHTLPAHYFQGALLVLTLAGGFIWQKLQIYRKRNKQG